MVSVKFCGLTCIVKSLAFHPRRPWLLVGMVDGYCEIYDYIVMSLICRFQAHNAPIKGADFHPTQPIFATCGDDSLVKLWSLTDQRLIYTFRGHKDYVRSVSFYHGNQPWLVSASDDMTSIVWSWQSHCRLADLIGHRDYVMCARWCETADESSIANKDNSNDLIATASLDGTVRVWDVSKLRFGRPMSAGPLIIANSVVGTSHDQGLNYVSWIKKNDKILTASDDNTVKMWALERSFGGQNKQTSNGSPLDTSMLKDKINEYKAKAVKTVSGYINGSSPSSTSSNGTSPFTSPKIPSPQSGLTTVLNYKTPLLYPEAKLKCIKTFDSHNNHVSAVASFCDGPNNEQISIISSSIDKTIRIYESTSKKSEILDGNSWYFEYCKKNDLVVKSPGYESNKKKEKYDMGKGKWWCLAEHPLIDCWAVGGDDGFVVFSINNEIPAYAYVDYTQSIHSMTALQKQEIELGTCYKIAKGNLSKITIKVKAKEGIVNEQDYTNPTFDDPKPLVSLRKTISTPTNKKKIILPESIILTPPPQQIGLTSLTDDPFAVIGYYDVGKNKNIACVFGHTDDGKIGQLGTDISMLSPPVWINRTNIVYLTKENKSDSEEMLVLAEVTSDSGIVPISSIEAPKWPYSTISGSDDEPKKLFYSPRTNEFLLSYDHSLIKYNIEIIDRQIKLKQITSVILQSPVNNVVFQPHYLNHQQQFLINEECCVAILCKNELFIADAETLQIFGSHRTHAPITSGVWSLIGRGLDYSSLVNKASGMGLNQVNTTENNVRYDNTFIYSTLSHVNYAILNKKNSSKTLIIGAITSVNRPVFLVCATGQNIYFCDRYDKMHSVEFDSRVCGFLSAIVHYDENNKAKEDVKKLLSRLCRSNVGVSLAAKLYSEGYGNLAMNLLPKESASLKGEEKNNLRTLIGLKIGDLSAYENGDVVPKTKEEVLMVVSESMKQGKARMALTISSQLQETQENAAYISSLYDSQYMVDDKLVKLDECDFSQMINTSILGNNINLAVSTLYNSGMENVANLMNENYHNKYISISNPSIKNAWETVRNCSTEDFVIPTKETNLENNSTLETVMLPWETVCQQNTCNFNPATDIATYMMGDEIEYDSNTIFGNNDLGNIYSFPANNGNDIGSQSIKVQTVEESEEKISEKTNSEKILEKKIEEKKFNTAQNTEKAVWEMSEEDDDIDDGDLDLLASQSLKSLTIIEKNFLYDSITARTNPTDISAVMKSISDEYYIIENDGTDNMIKWALLQLHEPLCNIFPKNIRQNYQNMSSQAIEQLSTRILSNHPFNYQRVISMKDDIISLTSQGAFVAAAELSHKLIGAAFISKLMYERIKRTSLPIEVEIDFNSVIKDLNFAIETSVNYFIALSIELKRKELPTENEDPEEMKKIDEENCRLAILFALSPIESQHKQLALRNAILRCKKSTTCGGHVVPLTKLFIQLFEQYGGSSDIEQYINKAQKAVAIIKRDNRINENGLAGKIDFADYENKQSIKICLMHGEIETKFIGKCAVCGAPACPADGELCSVCKCGGIV